MAETSSSDQPEAGTEQLDRTADLLRNCRQTFIDVVEAHSWQPEKDSQAEDDQRVLNEFDPNESVLEHPSGFGLVEEVAITNLELASLHVQGMAALYDAGWVFLTPEVLARSVIESLGHAVWVVGTSESHARQRLARAYLLHVASAKRERDLDNLRQDPGEDARGRLREARRRCRAAFPGSTTAQLTSGRLDGEQLPGLAAIVRAFFDTASEHGGLVAEKKHTDALYGYLSTATHPTLFRLRQLRKPSGESNALAIEVETDQSREPAHLTAMLFYIVLRTFVNYFGYPSEGCERLADNIDEVFPGSMLD